MQPRLQPELPPRQVAAFVLKAVALALAVATIVLGALRIVSIETLMLLLAVGLLALAVAAILDTRIITQRYVQMQPPPIPRQRRKKRR
ncbi:MAG TPA: hypothetical protein PLJ35_15030 [Anaerolineae bacterium]|nr:hypothetical protein [Anaerolineae bacterium]HOR00125.1 hypothetical protein [Anaerolineae bacterium]HPL28180.1 hypothetical protein [Anaerolineae bacterium]